MKNIISRPVLPFLSMIVLLGSLTTQCKQKSPEKPKPVNETDIVIPEGFSLQVVAEDLGNLRHMTVSKNGDIYVNRSKLKDDKAIVLLKDNDQDGKIDESRQFSDLPGTGVLIKNGYLYTSSNSGVYRYKLNEKEEIIDIDNPENIVEGLADMGRDNAKPFVLDENENLYITIGSWNDSCREEGTGNGIMPCTILDSAGGIWQFKADKLNQSFADGKRYATGVKNAVAIDWNEKTNSLFAAVHGRGAFHDFYPEHYTAKHSAELPAETLYELHVGDDAGWPYIYYDQFENKKMLAPEYGGDGKKTAGENAIDPIMAFPAHLAPNDLLFYTGEMFPEKYRNGAFIAFHGQSPELKKGYLVAFVPFKDGKPNGNWEIFADNFSGIDLANPSGPIQHRPCGLAQGPNGELYVSEDLKGTVYKITY
ncbi:PQQ-dependent sugar dehydrogenase [Arenibacter sp. F20364]|uniref:PQQ-dependent sugar dehydrogenase n=1 Tax=Arenibacter sp. F20364 TaxID=2926415 RepID=UPI001FF2A8AB|nr:PQQ-dependent sugar dehydrogenase [Arenibacter sp. F20364]MCK0190885.1 PQQ-dependent sugar dehydrogenase [Arenibacter sp. F20364]